MSSMEISSHERVCYVHCNFCNTILVVNVPCTPSMLNAATVRCGRCASLLSLNTEALVQAVHLQNLHKPNQDLSENSEPSNGNNSKVSVLESPQHELQPRALSVHGNDFKSLRSFQHLLEHAATMGKRQRPPSAYNRFIKEEIRRIKSNNPEISHRQAFSTAAKNWAHLPHTHFGLPLNSSNMNHVSSQGA